MSYILQGYAVNLILPLGYLIGGLVEALIYGGFLLSRNIWQRVKP